MMNCMKNMKYIKNDSNAKTKRLKKNRCSQYNVRKGFVTGKCGNNVEGREDMEYIDEQYKDAILKIIKEQEMFPLRYLSILEQIVNNSEGKADAFINVFSYGVSVGRRL